MSYDVFPLEVPERVKEQARALGLYGNLDVRISRMAKQAMPFGGSGTGLRRFDSFIFRIDDGVVVEMKLFKREEWDLKNSYQARRNAKRREKLAAKMLQPLPRDVKNSEAEENRSEAEPNSPEKAE
ncbi:hypothetical protein [Roseococcus pinisoli]|uniref:Uncharacterized protein n=1 Tax=Roseococcus pinisoli TaxID=2835040 RepID=A0ABS5QF94_9PROT|nr:hypothetical protein [Roseococcus pinisoli]MBS7812370.1 hypothetical protein [Roseococcus pinisoli]